MDRIKKEAEEKKRKQEALEMPTPFSPFRLAFRHRAAFMSIHIYSIDLS